jgi:uncharacterized membrane protein HdeD (DUF308 family)
MQARRFDIFSLIIGIFSLFVGYEIISHPVSGLITIMLLLGMFSLIRGIYQCWLAFRVHQLMMNSRIGWLVFSAIVDILLGIIFLFNLPLGLTTMIYILAFWFIIDGIAELSLAPIYRWFGKSYHWVIIILAVISIIAGIILLFRPMIGGVLIVTMVAVYFLMSGILEIVEAF